jgi:carboxysome peptide A
MKIWRVTGTVVSTNRIAMMDHMPLKLLEDKKNGSPTVAVDPIGCKEGDYVLCCGSSAARDATGTKGYPSDLTIVGILDHWDGWDE